jgi:PAS domain S-box-containing protein
MAKTGTDRERTVLVVEDQPDRLASLSELLRQSGYSVFEAAGGVQALETAKQRHPDVIVSDVLMPRLDGIELCRLVRNDAELCDTPILLVSADRKDSATVIAALTAGADDYLELPYDPGRLVAKVSRLSERRRAERASQTRLRALFATLADLVIVFDADGRHLQIASTRAGLLNRPTEELIGRTLHEVFPEGLTHYFLEHIRRALDIREPQAVEYTMEIEGTEVSLEGTVSPLSKDSVYWVVHDVTERKRAEAALRQSETRKAAVLDSVLDCIVTMDADGMVIEFNAAAERTFGYTKAEAIGRALADLIIPPPLRAAHAAGLARYLVTGEGPLLGKLLEITAVRSDGSQIPVELHYSR